MIEDEQTARREGLGFVRWWLTHSANKQGISWETIAEQVGAPMDDLLAWAEGRSAPDGDEFQSLARMLGDPNHPPGAEPDLDAPIKVHSFVIADNDLGIGKCIDVSEENATVEYFDTVSDTETRTVPVDELTAVRLSNQTRCYVYDPDAERWTMGRIRRLSDGDRIVELPDQDVANVDNRHLYVRWARPVEDPTETLKQKSQETVFFRNQRAPFVRALVEQRAASRGASGLLSSSIDLYSHQVEVVRRVLEDPIQRYLLADEVGLGKTIEAGVILRQHLIDHSGNTIRVFAPAVLCEQWRQELNEKFDLGALQGTVSVHPLEEIRDWTDGTAPDFIVIDEAHKVVGGAFEDDGKAEFRSIAKWVHDAERLLLLSATPAHRHEKEFLGMLHLIDPSLYDLNDLEAFRLRIKKRSEVGGMLRDFVEGEDAFMLDIALEDLRNAFPDDDLLLEAAETLEGAINADPVDEGARDQAIRTIRLHIKERYRLHHRMLRSRRTDADSEIDTERQAPSFPEYGMDPREEEVHELLDQWRLSALQVSERYEDREWAYVRLFRILMEVAMSDLSLLHEVIQLRLNTEASSPLCQDLSEAERQIVRTTPMYEGEKLLLEDLLGASLPGGSGHEDAFSITKEEWLEQFLERKVGQDSAARFVVFATYPCLAQRLAERLRATLGEECVEFHGEQSHPDAAQAAVRYFRENDRCQVLVCDRSAEEGLNLQFVEHLIHYDLPFSPNRLEQRTGRLDRIGRQGRPMHTHVYIGPEIDSGSMYDAWYTVLDKGFDVFGASIASLQFLVEGIQDDLVRHRFRSGAEHVDEHVASIQEEIVEEQNRIDRQFEFEALWAEQEGTHDFYDDLQELEEKSNEHASFLHGWIDKALQFHVRRRAYPDGMLQYRPDFNGRTLIPLDTVLNRFLPNSEKPVTYNRSQAVNSRSETGQTAMLMRIGHPFLDGLRDFFEWDDRGRAYAIWRKRRDWKALGREDQLFFRFEYVVEANTGSGGGARKMDGNQAAFQRRADAFFPPRFETVVTDQGGTVIENQGLIDLVSEKPHRVQDGGNDTNVKGDRVHLLDRFVDPLDWSNHCDQARDAAREALLNQDALIRQCREAEQQLQKDAQRRIQRLDLRATAEMVSDAQAEVFQQRAQQEKQHAKRLARGIRSPTVRLDSVGVIILSGSNCPSNDE